MRIITKAVVQVFLKEWSQWKKE